MLGMNKLPVAKRAQVLSMLCEGSSMQATARVCGVAFNSVVKLLADAGRTCEEFHDKTVRSVRFKRVQCDEIWSFAYAKQRNVAAAKAAPEDAGDIWTWTALDADGKLISAYQVGGRDGECARVHAGRSGPSSNLGATDHRRLPRIPRCRRGRFRRRHRLRR
jgi:hypothetical protein